MRPQAQAQTCDWNDSMPVVNSRLGGAGDMDDDSGDSARAMKGCDGRGIEEVPHAETPKSLYSHVTTVRTRRWR